jgi:hypothetical protein
MVHMNEDGFLVVNSDEIMKDGGKFVADLGLNPAEVLADKMLIAFLQDGKAAVSYTKAEYFDADGVRAALDGLKS